MWWERLISFRLPDEATVIHKYMLLMIRRNNPVAPVAQRCLVTLLTRWDVSSIPANGIFLTKNLKNKNKNAQRVEND